MVSQAFDEPWMWDYDEFMSWADVMLTSLQRAGATCRVDVVMGNASAFYDWAQGDLTLEQLMQFVNRCERVMVHPMSWKAGSA